MTRNRFYNALGIQRGACNPSGIALAIVDACKEIRDLPDHSGTAQITSDSAVRLMVHQLAYICGLKCDFESLGDYSKAFEKCEESK